MKSTHSPKLRPALADALVVLLVLALAIGTAWWFYGGLRRSGPAEYIITHRGEEIARGPLSQPQEIAVDGKWGQNTTNAAGGLTADQYANIYYKQNSWSGRSDR